jgi:hypothetical protein
MHAIKKPNGQHDGHAIEATVFELSNNLHDSRFPSAIRP